MNNTDTKKPQEVLTVERSYPFQLQLGPVEQQKDGVWRQTVYLVRS